MPSVSSLLTLRHELNGKHFASDIFKFILSNENCSIFIKISLKFIHSHPIGSKLKLVQEMGWHWTNPYLNQWWPSSVMYTCSWKKSLEYVRKFLELEPNLPRANEFNLKLMVYCNQDVTPLLTHWSDVFLVLTHRNVIMISLFVLPRISHFYNFTNHCCLPILTGGSD